MLIVYRSLWNQCENDLNRAGIIVAIQRMDKLTKFCTKKRLTSARANHQLTWAMKNMSILVSLIGHISHVTCGNITQRWGNHSECCTTIRMNFSAVKMREKIFVVHDVVSQHVGNGQMDSNGPTPWNISKHRHCRKVTYARTLARKCHGRGNATVNQLNLSNQNILNLWADNFNK